MVYDPCTDKHYDESNLLIIIISTPIRICAYLGSEYVAHMMLAPGTMSERDVGLRTWHVSDTRMAR